MVQFKSENMAKRNDFLDYYRVYFNNQETHQQVYEKYSRTIQKLVDHFVLEDEVNGTKHYNIIFDLYINPITLEYEEIAIKHSIEVRTLHRYRNKYNKYAKVIMFNQE